MIMGIVGGVVGGAFNSVCQMSFVSGMVLFIAIYLVWKCFKGDCWFEHCSTRDIESPARIMSSYEKNKSRDLYIKISEIVQKNLGISAKELVLNHA